MTGWPWQMFILVALRVYCLLRTDGPAKVRSSIRNGRSEIGKYLEWLVGVAREAGLSGIVCFLVEYAGFGTKWLGFDRGPSRGELRA
jgi:hypothetical protein